MNGILIGMDAKQKIIERLCGFITSWYFVRGVRGELSYDALFRGYVCALGDIGVFPYSIEVDLTRLDFSEFRKKHLLREVRVLLEKGFRMVETGETSFLDDVCNDILKGEKDD